MLRPEPGEGLLSSPVEIPAGLTAVVPRVFGERVAMAIRYASILAGAGVERGLIGPREGPRLWERHLLNCAVLGELLPPGDRVLDVGSGAGLPGIVLAVSRPDLEVTLLEPLARRATFLQEVVDDLGLATVTVIRGRAEEQRGRLRFPTVTARAVAPIDRLAGWCLPLVELGGRLLAMKGESAAEELSRHRGVLAKLGVQDSAVRQCGTGVVDPPTTVVVLERDRSGRSQRGGAGPNGRRRRRNR
jgi:16S rRNA (guanine527-N7)-methyltransferase